MNTPVTTAQKVATLGKTSIFSKMALKKAIKKQLLHVLDVGNAHTLAETLEHPYAAEVALGIVTNRIDATLTKQEKIHFPEALIRKHPNLANTLIKSHAFQEFSVDDKRKIIVACFDNKLHHCVYDIILTGVSATDAFMSCFRQVGLFHYFSPLSKAAFLGDKTLTEQLCKTAISEFKMGYKNVEEELTNALHAAYITDVMAGDHTKRGITALIDHTLQSIQERTPETHEAVTESTHQQTTITVDEPAVPKHNGSPMEQTIYELVEEVKTLKTTIKSLQTRIEELEPKPINTDAYEPENQAPRPANIQRLRDTTDHSQSSTRPKTTPPLRKG